MENSNLTERAEEIIKLAAQGLPMQGKTKPFDELLYYQAKELYGLFAKGMIEKQTGAERRQKITRAYIGNCKREKLWADQNQQTAALFKGIEAAGTAYAKNRTLDNADSLYYAIYRVCPGIGGKDG